MAQTQFSKKLIIIIVICVVITGSFLLLEMSHIYNHKIKTNDIKNNLKKNNEMF